MEIISIVGEGLGHSSYVVGLGNGDAVVIDPSRFPQPQQRVAAKHGWRIAWTADTHSHADYISGSPALATTGSTFLAPAASRLEVPHQAVEAGETIKLAHRTTLRAIATPGHTPDHLAYLVEDGGVPTALFSGGSLMVGTVGRTDLIGDEHREVLAAQLFRTIRDDILTLPDDLAVYPTHGAGSFCSAPVTSARTTTIGRERATNPMLRIDDEQEFIERLIAGLGTFPTYFRQLPERNRIGPRLYPEVPTLPSLGPDEVAEHLDDGAVLIDTRPIRAFAAGHPAGAISNVFRPVFASWLGWLVDLDRPIIFLLDPADDRTELVRECLTIGQENLVSELAGGVDAWAATGRSTATIPLAEPAASGRHVLDVRQHSEWITGHLPAATHVELGVIAEASVPDGPLLVMCGHGERAMTAASVLAGRGYTDLVVLAGGPDEWSRATGVALATGS